MLPLILFSLRILATVVWFRAAIVLSESPLRTVADRSVDLRLRLWRAAVERDCEAVLRVGSALGSLTATTARRVRSSSAR